MAVIHAPGPFAVGKQLSSAAHVAALAVAVCHVAEWCSTFYRTTGSWLGQPGISVPVLSDRCFYTLVVVVAMAVDSWLDNSSCTPPGDTHMLSVLAAIGCRMPASGCVVFAAQQLPPFSVGCTRLRRAPPALAVAACPMCKILCRCTPHTRQLDDGVRELHGLSMYESE